MNSKENLQAIGFSGFKTIQELFENSLFIPKEKGVYIVFREDKEEPTFLIKGTGGFFKKEDPNVDITILKKKWLVDESIVYIGKAGGTGKKATLHSRLVQYLKFGQGKDIGHRGGRYIWQLEDSKTLIVCWKILPNEEPRDVEYKMIQDFKSNNKGKRPFANLQD